MTDMLKAEQVGLFEKIEKKRPDVAKLIETRFDELLSDVAKTVDDKMSKLLTDVETLIDQNGDNYFGLEPPERLRVWKYKTQPDDVVLSFGKQTPPDKASVYIGVEVLNKLQWQVGDKIWIRSIPERRSSLYDQELLPTDGFTKKGVFLGKSYQISHVPKVWKYKRIVFPLSFFNFTPWKGRRRLHYTATDGALLVRFPGDFT